MTPAAPEPLDTAAAKRRIRAILESGITRFSSHALDEMKQDDLSTVDCVNVLRGGVVQPPDLERGTWRYRVLTNRICVVVALRSDEELVVVTAWRIRAK